MSNLYYSSKHDDKYDLPAKSSVIKKLDAIIFLFGSEEFTKSDFLDIVSAENINTFIAELYLKQLTRNATLKQVSYKRYKNASFL